MKKVFLVVTVFFLALPTLVVQAQTSIPVGRDSNYASNCYSSSGQLPPYTPLEPLPGGASTYGGTTAFTTYLKNFFVVLLALGAMVAIVTLVIGGVAYMASESLGKKIIARERIQAALIGLLLLLGSYLILNTINPNLLSFNFTGGTPGADTPASSSSTGVQGANSAGDTTSGSQTAAATPETYSASSDTAREYETSLNITLHDTPDGKALMILPTNTISTAVDTINAFTQGCETNGQGKTQTAASTDGSTTAYICQQV